MRISVELILSLLAQGESPQALVDDYPGLDSTTSVRASFTRMQLHAGHPLTAPSHALTFDNVGVRVMLALVFAAGCNATGVTPEAATAGVTGAVEESARHMGPDDPVVVLGWHVVVAGDRVRWRACTLATACTFQDRETDAANLLHADDLGQATVAASEGPRTVAVQRITLRSGAQVRP